MKQKILFSLSFLVLLKDFYFQKRLSKKLIKTLPRSAQDSKIYHTYAIQIVSCIAILYCEMRGKKISKVEKKTQVYLSFLAALMDIETDQKIKNISEVIVFFKSLQLPHSPVLENICFIIQQLRKNIDDQPLKELIRNSLLFQLESLRQTKSNDIAYIKEITWNKCGYSFLFSRMLLNHKIIANEQAFCFHYGGIGQLGDDILDIYDDKRDGIETIAHMLNNEELTTFYMNELLCLFDTIRKLGYKTKHIQKAVRKLCIVTAIPLVQIDLLTQQGITTGKIFSIHTVTREHTICDMQKFSVLRRSFTKSVSLYRLFLGLNS